MCFITKDQLTKSNARATKDNVVTTKQIELLHLRLRQGNHRVVIIERLLDNEPVRRAFRLLQRYCWRRHCISSWSGCWSSSVSHGSEWLCVVT